MVFDSFASEDKARAEVRAYERWYREVYIPFMIDKVTGTIEAAIHAARTQLDGNMPSETEVIEEYMRLIWD